MLFPTPRKGDRALQEHRGRQRSLLVLSSLRNASHDLGNSRGARARLIMRSLLLSPSHRSEDGQPAQGGTVAADGRGQECDEQARGHAGGPCFRCRRCPRRRSCPGTEPDFFFWYN
eukprot:3938299-Rhodomonas_salina.2